MYTQHVWPAGEEVTRRAMHTVVCETGWSSPTLMQRHREVIAREHCGGEREVIGIDWTRAHHERGPHIYGVKKAYDSVAKRTSLFQTIITAVVANHELAARLKAQDEDGQIAKT